MARPIRVEFPGAVYHVMARGNERRAVFRDDQDRQRFLETIGEMVDQFGVLVHAFCLMPNHYHLLLETPQANLSQAVGWLQVTYTVRFNRRHRRSGHLFQGRFKAQLVEADGYAQWLVEYIHLNPVRPHRKGGLIEVGRAEELEAYGWSSHRDYAGGRRKPPIWLSLTWRRYWGRTVAEAQAGYRRRIREIFEKREVDSPWTEMRNGLVLGGDALWQQVKAAVSGRSGAEEMIWTKAADASNRLERVRKLTEDETDKWIRIWALVRLAGQRQSDIAREFGYANGSSVLYALRQLEQRKERDVGLRARLEWLSNQFERLKS